MRTIKGLYENQLNHTDNRDTLDFSTLPSFTPRDGVHEMS